EVLLAEARSCKRIELYTAFSEIADDKTRTAFRELVRRRAEGTPVAYLVGKREFFSLSFRVTPDVLIPRPETEMLVVRALDLAKSQFTTLSPGARGQGEGEAQQKSAPSLQPSPSKGEGVRILDIGTGSGSIAICVAKHAAQLSITAIDTSRAALAV